MTSNTIHIDKIAINKLNDAYGNTYYMLHKDGKPPPKAIDIDQITFKHILPKANEIVNTSEGNIKSIYPFSMISPEPSLAQHYIHSHTYEQRNNKNKFVPLRKNLLDHFKPQHIVYHKFHSTPTAKITALNLYSIDKLKFLSKNDFLIYNDQTDPFVSQNTPLSFDSRFQSGNLATASHLEDMHCLLLHNDVNTTGYTNWFYFSAQNNHKSKKYQAKFTIMNYGKAGWPMNNFPGVCLWSDQRQVWERKSCQAQCESNSNLYSDCKDYERFNTLYFQYEFEPQEKIFFAYNPPYTYTDLLKTLDRFQEQKLPFFHRKLAGTSLIGNRIEMITIANFELLKKTEVERPVIVIIARTHPGETVSSWVMHELIKFLLSDAAQASTLRDSFVFKIFPMVNPDGVIHGNYRCSLIGRDLNRRWKNPQKELYPQVYFIKNQIIDTHQKKQIKMIIDLHGHTQKRRAFFYGCTEKTAPHKTRLFPYLASKLSTSFDFNSCNFAMEKNKESTARMTLFNLIKIPEIFTIETSQFGMNERFIAHDHFRDIAETICKGIARFFRVDRNSGQAKEEKEVQDYEEEFMNNPNLLKIGCQPSDGSDSQPSVCNLQFDKINKLATERQRRPSTEISPRKRVFIRPQSSIKEVHSRKQGLSVGGSKELNEKSCSQQKTKDKNGETFIQTRGSGPVPQRRIIRPNTTKAPKHENTREVQPISRIRDFAGELKPLPMINFQLLITQSNRRRPIRDAFDLGDMNSHHINYHMFQKKGSLSRPLHLNKNSL